MAEPHKINRGPHGAVIALVAWLLPERRQESVTGDLHTLSLSSWSYLAKGCEWLVFLVASQLRPAFSSRLFCAEAAALAAAFAGTPLNRGFLIGISASLAGLVLRDAYVYPKQGNPFHEGVNTAVALLFLIAVQILEMVFAQDHAVSPSIRLRVIALALLTVSMVRVILRRRPDQALFDTPSFAMTRSMTGLWIGAALVVKVLEPPLLPEFLPYQDFWLTFLPIAAFGLAYRLQKSAMDDSLRGGSTTFLHDHAEKELRPKLQWLWTPTGPWDLAMECLAFGLYGLPLAITLLSWAGGYLPPAKMNWWVAAPATCGLLALSLLWIAIRKTNQDLAALLHQKIKTRQTS